MPQDDSSQPSTTEPSLIVRPGSMTATIQDPTPWPIYRGGIDAILKAMMPTLWSDETLQNLMQVMKALFEKQVLQTYFQTLEQYMTNQWLKPEEWQILFFTLNHCNYNGQLVETLEALLQLLALLGAIKKMTHVMDAADRAPSTKVSRLSSMSDCKDFTQSSLEFYFLSQIQTTINKFKFFQKRELSAWTHCIQLLEKNNFFDYRKHASYEQHLRTILMMLDRPKLLVDFYRLLEFTHNQGLLAMTTNEENYDRDNQPSAKLFKKLAKLLSDLPNRLRTVALIRDHIEKLIKQPIWAFEKLLDFASTASDLNVTLILKILDRLHANGLVDYETTFLLFDPHNNFNDFINVYAFLQKKALLTRDLALKLFNGEFALYFKMLVIVLDYRALQLTVEHLPILKPFLNCPKALHKLKNTVSEQIPVRPAQANPMHYLRFIIYKTLQKKQLRLALPTFSIKISLLLKAFEQSSNDWSSKNIKVFISFLHALHQANLLAHIPMLESCITQLPLLPSTWQLNLEWIIEHQPAQEGEKKYYLLEIFLCLLKIGLRLVNAQSKTLLKKWELSFSNAAFVQNHSTTTPSQQQSIWNFMDWIFSNQLLGQDVSLTETDAQCAEALLDILSYIQRPTADEIRGQILDAIEAWVQGCELCRVTPPQEFFLLLYNNIQHHSEVATAQAAPAIAAVMPVTAVQQNTQSITTLFAQPPLAPDPTVTPPAIRFKRPATPKQNLSTANTETSTLRRRKTSQLQPWSDFKLGETDRDLSSASTDDNFFNLPPLEDPFANLEY